MHYENESYYASAELCSFVFYIRVNLNSKKFSSGGGLNQIKCVSDLVQTTSFCINF